MAGRALLKIYIFQLAASFPVIGLLRTSSLCPSFVKFIVIHILQLDFDLCAVLYVSDASRSIKYVMNRRCDESAYLHKVSNLSTSFHNSVACASSLLLIACVFYHRMIARSMECGGPNIVKVLPAPVCPYDIKSTSYPSSQLRTSGCAITSYTRAWVSSGASTAAA